MKKQKTITDRVRSMLETEVVELTQRRSLIDEELKVLVKMMGVVAPRPKHRWTKKPTAEVALALLKKHDEVTPAMLAEEARVSGAVASQTLIRLADDKKVKKARRGVFTK